ncbi:hypothetical protein [Fodinibius sp.]|uniref:hypothetical protein n=1 Tax=Fodinibius sp. TaxID=1872440 RepID=UPI002ACDCD97|nr:hypothetical protein [Fodinibius sp.]MDZ7660744.1 hypothetical protein [Fodinibius sp.]
MTFQYFKDKNGREYLGRVFLIEPEEVEYKSKTKGSSKRKPNLTYEELEQSAEENGCLDIYETLFKALEDPFYKQTTRSSVSFKAEIDGGNKSVFNLIPTESSSEKGLKFQIYKYRISQLLDITQEELRESLPSNIEDWIYYDSAPEEYEGYEGYFENSEQVETFLNKVKKEI